MPGRVTFVGAGPGAADLLTVRAVTALHAATVVLHDDLVPQEVLDMASPSAEVINTGKRCGRHGTAQEQINALMVSHARRGAAVVRLKSGDPAVFGRLGEELDALREAEIQFEIVPGVTAAIAAAAAANVTLTDRRTASALVLLTAHRCTGAHTEALLDPERTTYAVYMPGPDYTVTARQLLSAGLEDTTPCALISRAGRQDQQIHRMLLGELLRQPAAPAPALLIVGEVAAQSNRAESAFLLEQIIQSNHQLSIPLSS